LQKIGKEVWKTYEVPSKPWSVVDCATPLLTNCPYINVHFAMHSGEITKWIHEIGGLLCTQFHQLWAIPQSLYSLGS